MAKNILIAVLLLAVGAGGAFFYVQNQTPSEPEETSSDHAGHNHPPGYCVEHEIMEAQCPWCDPSLIEKLGMCVGHGVPEAFCSRCNPALIPGFKAENDWCAEHGLPESQCLECNPELGDTESGEIDLGLSESPFRVEPVADLPRNQQPPALACGTEQLRVRFVDDHVAEEVGLEYEAVKRRLVTETMTCNAKLTYHPDQHAHLPPRAPGIVQEVPGRLGDAVTKGDVLAVVDSAELGAAKAAFLQALAMVDLWERNHERARGLFDKRVATEQEVLEAETSLAESRIALSRSRQQLRTYGLSAAQVDEIARTEDTSSRLSVLAPFDGVIVERHAVVGEVVDTSRPLFAVADTGTLWAVLDVREVEASRLSKGAPMNLQLDGLRGLTYPGRIAWVSTEVDPRTRTLKAYAEIPNPDGRLRASMFGTATVMVRQQEPSVMVPESAVQWDGCCNVAFVRRSASQFEPRKLHLGYETDGHYVVESGLQEGEAVVTTGSFLLKTEIMKESIGAGCCEVELGT